MTFTKGKKLGLAAILVGLCTIGAVGVASAHDGDGPGDKDGRRAELIKKFDKNGDGKLDDAEKAAMHAAMKAEHEAREQELLAKYDTNKDGKLDDAERQAMRDDMITKVFGEFDTDHDGKLSLDEVKAGLAKHEGFGAGGFGGGFGHHHGRRGHGGMRHGGMHHGGFGGGAGGAKPDGGGRKL